MEVKTEKHEQGNIPLPNEPIHEISSLGEGLLLKKRQTVELDEEFANNFMELAEIAGDRPLRTTHVIYLARQMEAELFRWEQASLITCICEGREYRMNGQHTCWARIEAKLPKHTRTPIQLLKYEAKSMQDMRQLYATIDRGMPRNMGQVVTSYLAEHPDFPNFNQAILRRLAEGLAQWLWEASELRKLHTGDERAYLLLTTHHKTALAVGSFLRESRKEGGGHLCRGPVIAAMFATFAKAPQIAKDFWTLTRDGVGITSKSHPCYTLRNWLLSAVISNSASPVVTGKSVASNHMLWGCLQAWNAFRADRDLKHISPHKLSQRPEPK
jgi:hypothetical protein